MKFNCEKSLNSRVVMDRMKNSFIIPYVIPLNVKHMRIIKKESSQWFSYLTNRYFSKLKHLFKAKYKYNINIIDRNYK